MNKITEGLKHFPSTVLAIIILGIVGYTLIFNPQHLAELTQLIVGVTGLIGTIVSLLYKGKNGGNQSNQNETDI